MGASWVPFSLLVAGGVLYHLSQKAAGGGGSPWPILVVAYGAGLAMSALMWLALPAGTRPPRGGELAAAALIGLAAMTIEAGFFLAYRNGMALGTTSLLATLVVSAVLAILGMLLFGESMTWTRAGGVAVAAIGAWFIVRG